MSKKAVTWCCSMCGAELNGIGDWVEHDCPNLTSDVAGYTPRARRRIPRANAMKVDTRCTPMEPSARTFEELLTDEDRTWMRKLETAFAADASHSAKSSEQW